MIFQCFFNTKKLCLKLAFEISFLEIKLFQNSTLTIKDSLMARIYTTFSHHMLQM